MTVPALHLPAAVADAPDDNPVRARLGRIMEGSDFPALSKQIIEMITSLDEDGSSLQRLANVVLREYSLTLCVVRTANSVHYRRSGRAIQSATHAMMMLGAKTVRQLAGSLLLFENFHRRSPALKELMLLSLLTANHAREVAVVLGMQEPEEAHLCGMFRNLGEVLIACHFAEDYARIQTMMRGEGASEAAATKAVLGFAFGDLGAEVATQWGMPESVVQGIRARAASSVSRSASITAFSHDLTYALYHREHAGNAGAAALEVVLEQHAARIKLTREQLRAVVAAALHETREIFSSPHIPTDRLRFRQLSEAAKTALGGATLVTGEWQATVQDAGESDATDLRHRLRLELESAADALSGTSLSDVLLLGLEAALRGGPFDRVIMCVVDADRGRLVARSGLGEGIDALMPHFDFPMTMRGGPIVLATQQRHALYVPADRPMNVAEARWASSLSVAQFGVFPVVVGGKIVGCLYCDRTVGSPLAAVLPDRATLRYLKSLTDLVVTAIGSRRRLPAGAASPAHGIPLPIAAGTFSAEEKADLVVRLLQGAAPEALSQEQGVPVSELAAWRADFLAGAIARLGQS
jgi:HD-like signal output (HDOD) protein